MIGNIAAYRVKLLLKLRNWMEESKLETTEIEKKIRKPSRIV